MNSLGKIPVSGDYVKGGRVRVICSFLPVLLLTIAACRADEPYARSRDYDLRHSRISLRFDVGRKMIFGNVTHSLAILRDGTTQVAFDSVGLNIQNVTVNKAAVKFTTSADKVSVPLPAVAKAGDKFDISIRYEGRPSKGIYFILPDKDDPGRPTQVWTQGESEDTRYYLPTYDYPNDRLTTETILTVPASWITVSNGKLTGVTTAAGGMKTWTWKESVPSSTYLITVVAGEFDEVKDSWSGIPLSYYAPKGRGNRLLPNYGHTPAMMELFSKKIGVAYPWEKYAQAMVDDFVAGGMENSSATTNASVSLVHPQLAPEFATGQDPLIAHELAHQWFGDLVTCKDWGNVWLNEGFATLFETVWTEAQYPKEQSEYERWSNVRDWFAQRNLFENPVVRRDFQDSSEFDGNVYTKGGLVLGMLRHQLGEDAFYRGLKNYLEANRGENVVTADLVKALEKATNTNLDQFFSQWVYGAGAPKFDLSYVYDEAKHQIALAVKQTQKTEGRVGIFRVPVEVEVVTGSGSKVYPIVVSKTLELFSFPADSQPLMVLFDKGGHVLKSAEFHKEKQEWRYQLKNASEFADRADAIQALEKLKSDSEVITALGAALKTDPAWGIRATAADALGKVGGTASAKQLLDALSAAKEPWVRHRIVTALGNFPGDEAIFAKIDAIAREDKSYRARAAALGALAHLRAPSAFATLSAAVAGDSPDDFLRNAALRAFGTLGDDKAVPLLRTWSEPGKSVESRSAAVTSLGMLGKNDAAVTKQIAGYLSSPHFTLRMAAIHALGERGDASSVPALEALLRSDDLSIEMAPLIKTEIARIDKSAGKSNAKGENEDDGDAGDGQEAGNTTASEKKTETDKEELIKRLDRLERLVREMDARLKSMGARLPPPSK
ncbi:MAG: M1 family aminopeptidase [Candidatus Acidiferrum sp.]